MYMRGYPTNTYPQHNVYPQIQPQQRQPGHWGAYLLGLRPDPPPPTQQEIATAYAQHALDNQFNEVIEVEDIDDEEEEEEEEDGPVAGGSGTQQELPPPPTEHVAIQIPLGNNTVRNVSFASDTPPGDILDRIYAGMGLNPASDNLGWKTCDEGERAPHHQLKTNEDVADAMERALAMKSNARRKKPVFLKVTHLNPPVAEATVSAKGKKDPQASDVPYSSELRIVKEKLSKCKTHCTSPGRFCWTDPDTLEHTHDGECDADCARPPNVLRIQQLREDAAKKPRGRATKNDGLPIHIHVHTGPTPLGDSSTNLADNVKMPPGKRRRSPSPDFDESSDSEDEGLELAEVLLELDARYPLLELEQYLPLLAEQGIAYAETVLKFDFAFYKELGVAVGAIDVLLDGVKKALRVVKRERKRAKIADKENRATSEEV